MRREINEGYDVIAELRELFIKRMTVDSETNDARRKDFNQAIFFYSDYADEWTQVYNDTSMEMVLKCFDDAVRDWRRSFCDIENCKEPKHNINLA